MTDIFISYSRRDIAFARLLYQALKDNQLEIWIDWERIPVGENWWNEITGAIEGADVFMFIISHHSLGSEVCKKEISHALANHKRVIPVIVDDLKTAEITEFMPELGRINWMIFQREQVFHLEESSEEERTVAFPKQPMFDLSMLLAVRSYDTAANVQSLQGLMTALDYSPRLAHILPARGKTGASRLIYGSKTTMALSPDGKTLAVLDCVALDKNALFCASTEVRMWDTATWQRIGSPICARRKKCACGM